MTSRNPNDSNSKLEIPVVRPRIDALRREQITELLKTADVEIDGANNSSVIGSNHDYWEKLLGKRVAVRGGIIHDVKGGPVIGTTKGTLHLEVSDRRDFGRHTVVGILKKDYGLGVVDPVAYAADQKLWAQEYEREVERRKTQNLPDDDLVPPLLYAAVIACPPDMDVKTANTYFRLESPTIIPLE